MRRGKKKLLAHGLTVGYDADAKQLVVTLDEKLSDRLKKDGWTVHDQVEGMPPFVMIEKASTQD